MYSEEELLNKTLREIKCLNENMKKEVINILIESIISDKEHEMISQLETEQEVFKDGLSDLINKYNNTLERLV